MVARSDGTERGGTPSSGLTYVNMDINYDAGTFNGPQGNAVPVTGNYNVWAVENIFVYVTDTKFIGGHLGFEVMFPTLANGSLVADFPLPNQGATNLGVSGGGIGLADLWLQPFTLGWHWKRLDFTVGDAFMVPTGRYSPGATNNIGSGYFGNHVETGSTFYLTKNKGRARTSSPTGNFTGLAKAPMAPIRRRARLLPSSGASARFCH